MGMSLSDWPIAHLWGIFLKSGWCGGGAGCGWCYHGADGLGGMKKKLNKARRATQQVAFSPGFCFRSCLRVLARVHALIPPSDGLWSMCVSQMNPFLFMSLVVMDLFHNNRKQTRLYTIFHSRFVLIFYLIQYDANIWKILSLDLYFYFRS